MPQNRIVTISVRDKIQYSYCKMGADLSICIAVLSPSASEANFSIPGSPAPFRMTAEFLPQSSRGSKGGLTEADKGDYYIAPQESVVFRR
jgi:hypothetical protein